jgi:hypothetical protein
VTTGLVLLLWLVVAVPATVVKRTLASFGVADFPPKVAAAAQRFGVFGSSLKLFFDGLGASMRSVGEGASVELALNERHHGIRLALRRAEQAIRQAADKVAGLEGAKSAQHLAGEIRTLAERTKVVENIGAEFDDDIADQYAAGAGAKVWLIALLFGSIFVFALNGSLLAQFFRELFPLRLLGTTIGQILAYAIVVVEILLGLCAGLALSKKGIGRFVFLAALVVVGVALALTEYAAFSALSANIDDEFYARVGLPTNWLAILGPAFVILNAVCGYFIHHMGDEVVRHSGVKRLQRELKQADSFVRALPATWEGIDTKARGAEKSVQRYVDELGGQSDRMSGLVDNMASERDQVLTALRAVQLDDRILEGKDGDVAIAWARAVGMFALAVMWTIGFVLGFAPLLALSLDGRIGPLPAAGLAALVAVGFATVGLLAYGRVQHALRQRLLPISTNLLSLVVAAVFAVGCLTGFCWICVEVLDTAWGALLGILLTALCVPFTLVGYRIDEVARGGMLISTVVARFVTAFAAAALAVCRYALLWVLAALAWLLNAALGLLAAPVEMALRAMKKQDAPRTTGSTEADPHGAVA